MRRLGSVFLGVLVVSLTACQSVGEKRAENGGNKPLTVDQFVPVTVERFVESHQAVMKELAEQKATSQQTLETAQRSLALLEDVSRRHGSGEITSFFPARSATLNQDEKERLVRFADFLSREARGRKILLVSIGSASAFGDPKVNTRLADKRAEVPIDFMDKYLVNIPHEYFKVYGTGDLYSPKNVKTKEHGRYQHTRIIAVFDGAQLPSSMNAPAK